MQREGKAEDPGFRIEALKIGTVPSTRTSQLCFGNFSSETICNSLSRIQSRGYSQGGQSQTELGRNSLQQPQAGAVCIKEREKAPGILL